MLLVQWSKVDLGSLGEEFVGVCSSEVVGVFTLKRPWDGRSGPAVAERELLLFNMWNMLILVRQVLQDVKHSTVPLDRVFVETNLPQGLVPGIVPLPLLKSQFVRGTAACVHLSRMLGFV